MRSLWLAALLAAPASATRPLTPPAPEFPAGDAWLNGGPFTLQMLSGRKAVLVFFMNPTGLHSLRLLSVVKSWFDRYALNQLMVIGVITPDLAIQKDAAWVKTQLKRFDIPFPILIDADRQLWEAYANDGWPALFLIDRKGRLVFDHLGEGDYEEFEREIRDALAELTSPLPTPVAPPEPPSKNCGHASADIPMGARVKTPPLVLGADSSHRAALLIKSRENELAVHGKWSVAQDGMRLAQTNPDQAAFVRIVYQGAQALGVLAPTPGRKSRFFIKLDDQWLYEGTAGKDVRFDDDGRSYVFVDEPRLYDLARDSGEHPHELYVIPETTDSGVYGFTFADACTPINLP